MKFEWERRLNLDLFSWALRSSWSHGGTKNDAHTSFVDEWDTDEYCWIPSNVLISVSEERWLFCPQPLGGLEHLWLHFSMHCVNVSEHVHSFTCVFRCVNGFSNNRHVRVLWSLKSIYGTDCFSHVSNEQKRPPATGGVCVSVTWYSTWKLDLEG